MTTGDVLYFGVWGTIIVFMCGLIVGGWLRDRVWRDKANGTAMCSGGKFYYVLTNTTYVELLKRNYR